MTETRQRELDAALKRKAAFNEMLKLGSYKDRFIEIYEQNFWTSAESNSGQGSEIGYTERLRDWLPLIIKKHGITNIVDAPCGDFNWMKAVLPDLCVTYLGVDIVDLVIENNIQNHSTSGIKFRVADICSDRLPKCDLLIVRDCLFHLSYHDIGRFLKNIENVEYEFLLTTTHFSDDVQGNTDITTGDFRTIDLFDSPFCFSKNSVIDRVDDFPVGFPTEREMILVRKADVPTKCSL